jgi:hypothetical protein
MNPETIRCRCLAAIGLRPCRVKLVSHERSAEFTSLESSPLAGEIVRLVSHG